MRAIADDDKVRLFCSALICGLLEYLAHPGVGLWWLAPLIWVPLLTIRKLSRGSAAAAFGLCGAVGWGLAIRSLPTALASFSSHGGMVEWCAWIGAVSVQAVPYALGGFFYATLRELRCDGALSFATAMTVSESFSPTLIPYTHAATGVDIPVFLAATSVVGRELGAFLFFLSSAALSAVVVDIRKFGHPKLRVGNGAFLALACALALASSVHADIGARVRIGVLQSGLAQAAHKDDPLGLLQWHRERSRALAAQSNPDLLVWGETVLAAPRPAKRHLEDLHTGDLPQIVSGAVIEEEDCAGCGYRNSVLVSGACETCRYDKGILVPFAESSHWLMKLSPDPNRSWFTSGSTPKPVDTTIGPIGTPICYEAIFGERVSALASQGALLLVNLVSDRWLPSSMPRRAHEALARVTAVEAGLPLVRVVDQGNSAVWTSRGALRHRLRTEGPDAVVVEVTLAAGPSWYLRNRSWLLVAEILLGMAFLFITRHPARSGTVYYNNETPPVGS